MIRSLIVDDELPACNVLKNYIDEFCHEDVEIVAIARSVKEALKAIRIHRPELVFLDIEMPNDNGFDLLRKAQKIDFKVIFVTGYSEYAIQAFRFSAVDYLLKPINIIELREAVAKVKKDIDQQLDHRNLEILISGIRNPDKLPETMVIRDTEGFKVLKNDEIIYCKADGYCTHFYLTGNHKETSSRNLKYYEELLGGYGFQRVHNSFLVNLKHVCKYLNEGNIELSENQHAPLGDVYKRSFFNRFSLQ
jgi:two-component system, LytTR family, response regulator